MRSADPGQAPRDDLAALRHELREQADVLVIDGLNFLHAELANLLAPEIFAPAFAAAARAARTWGTAFADRQMKAGRQMDDPRKADPRPPDARHQNLLQLL